MKRNPDRVAAKREADARGNFWLPCSRCGEWYGGHEWHHMPGVRCLLSPTTNHGACCPKVSDGEDAHACRRQHERVGERAGCIVHEDCLADPALAAACYLSTFVESMETDDELRYRALASLLTGDLPEQRALEVATGRELDTLASFFGMERRSTP